MNAYEIAQQHPMVRDTPSVNFFEGAILGNGGQGAILCVRPDAILLHFGHNNVWDIRLSENNRDKIGTFQEIFEKISRIPSDYKLLTDDPWYNQYLKIAQQNYRKPYPRPFPCGSLVFGFDRRRVEALGYELDISAGQCRVNLLVDGKPQYADIFADMVAERLWLKTVDAEGHPVPGPFNRVKIIPDPKTPASLPHYTAHVSEGDRKLSFHQVLPYAEPIDTAPAPAHARDKAFRLQVCVSADLKKNQELHVNGLWQEMEELERALSGSAPFVAVVELHEGLASSIPQDNPPATPTPTVAAFDAARQTSQQRWRDFWSMSALALADKELERTWYHNLYFLNCAVRAGMTCPGLFANWSLGDIGTAWHGDYHMNYNTQQPFWVTFSSNHLDKHLPYVDMVHHLLPSSRAWAKNYYGMRGAFFPHSAYPVDMTMNPYPVPTWGWEVFETPWTVQSLWWHYQYSMDRDFLADRVFEPLRDATLFMIDYMMRPDAHGPQWHDDKYHIFPTVPPELYELRPGFQRNADGLTDLTLTRFLFNAFTEACTLLDRTPGEQATLAAIQEILEHYPAYPTAQTELGPIFCSVRDEEPGIVYNCPVSTITVFPGEEHGLHSAPEDYALALNAYRHQQNEGGNELVFLNLQAARLGVLDLEKFKRQVAYCRQANGACTNKVLQTKGRYPDTMVFDWMGDHGIWFENVALPVVINECLMQSYTGIIRLFPNWPSGKDAAFQSLRALGAFLVSCERRNGTIINLEIHSEAGGVCRLYTPWAAASLSIRQGTDPVTFSESDGILSFETAPGRTYRFSRVDEMSDPAITPS